MILKSLTIQGFKSFAERTTVEFPSGVAAVVGPNGSGKSNISDAIRWVLGEQSLRLLRGNRLEDVIFAGSDSKRAVGMAEVSLTFDNSANLIPLEYSEVTVSRRVYRSGESEFSINRSPCRLRDIQELFMDTGLGRGTLAIIGQGEVDLLLNARPEDRRAFLEEAAGITRYRVRKAEAVQRLAQTSEDLLRLGDILAEIERQLEPLAQQAEAARTYQKLVDELATLEGVVLWQRHRLLEQKFSSVQEARQKVVEEKEAYHRRLRHLEEASLEQEKQLDQLEQSLDEARRLKEQALLTQTEARHQQEITRQRLAQIEREKDERRERIDGLTRQRRTLQGEMEAADEAFQEIEAKCAAEKAAVDQLKARQEALRQQFQGHDTDEDKIRARWEEVTEKAFILKTRLQSVTDRQATLRGQAQEHRQAKGDIERELKDVTDEVSRFRQSMEDVQARLDQNEKEIDEVKKELGRLSSLRSEEEKNLSVMHRRLQDSKAKYRALLEMEEDREGYHRGVKAVLNEARKRGWQLYGAVAELFHVPRELETAIEVALGASQQFVIAKQDSDAKAAIEYLKASKHGRATFLPLDSLRPQTPSQEAINRLATVPGAIGVAAELVEAEDHLRPAVQYLLGRVAVARSLDAAIQIARVARGFSRVVTLDGDVVVPGGAMTGGSRPGQGGGGLLGRSRRLAQLKEQFTAEEKLMTEGQKRLDESRRREQEAENHVAQLEQHRRQLELIKHTASRDLQEANLRYQRVESSLENWQRQEEKITAELAQLESEKERIRLRLQESEEEQLQIDQAMEAREKQLDAYRQEQDALRDQLGTLQITLAGLLQEKEFKGRDIRRLAGEASAIEQAFQQEESRLKQLEAQQKDGLATMELSRKRQQEAEESLRRASDKESEIATVREEIRQARVTIGQQLKDVRDDMNKIQERLTKVEVDVDRLARELSRAQMELADRGITERPEGIETRDMAAVERRTRWLKGQIDAIGPVSLESIQQFQSVSERFNFLTAQKADLEEAKEKLHQVIARIDKESRAKFDALFQQVQDQFKTMFSRLFGGGNARLELVDPERPLESGIDIFVQPPGKRLQNLLALSGGERALAAIALLFAILAVRPSPFCVLDEVDAALDEHNLGRFRDLLKQFAVSTQFLIITHRQGTMESADTLFGVTMEESGVSRLVSLNLDQVKSA